VAPLPPRLEAQRQRLEAQREELKAQREELEVQRSQLEEEIQELEAEAREVDPKGRLTPEQLFTLLQERERRGANDEVDPVPAVIGVMFSSCSLTAFLAWLLANNRKQRLLHETVRLMVEKGAEIPSALLAPPVRKRSDLRRGIILSSTGLGLALFLAALPDMPGAWGAGVTLFLLGVGHLLVWRLQQVKGPWSSALASELQS
jgi:hypothetical protein